MQSITVSRDLHIFLTTQASHAHEGNINDYLSSFFKITNTPTFAVIDKKGVLRYRGSFDDSPEESDVTKHYLSDAVVAVLDSKSVPVANTRPFG